MKFGLITDFIRNESTGIGKYAEGLIKGMLNYFPSNSEFYFIDYISNDFNKQNLYLVNYLLPFGKISFFHSYLPIVTKRLQLDYIFNFSMMPHLFSYRQKEIFVIHDLTFDLFPQFHTWQTVLINKLLMRKTLNNAHKIIVNSEKTKKDLINIYSIPKDKIFKIFIPYFYDKPKIREVRPKIDLDKPYILNINTIEPRKNIIRLVEAFNIFKKNKKIPHKLIIVGKNGWKYRPILNFINKSPFLKDIILCGYISEEEKIYLLKNADVFVYPSFYEGFGIPILEALVYNCPVITTYNANALEISVDSALFVNPNDVLDIGNAIFKVITNPELKKKLVINGKKDVKKYLSKQNIKKNVRSLFKFLNS